MVKFIFCSLIFPCSFVFAQVDLSVPRGSETVKLRTPENLEEICIVPQHAAFGSYSKSDVKNEKKLCSFDFHGLGDEKSKEQMALCPKLNSTNPGVLVMKVPHGWERNQFESKMCIGKNDLQETEAKFKQTITCSYTPSILSYYHFSRYLDGAGRVPVAVLRSISKERHFQIVEQAYGPAQKVGGIIKKGWSDLKNFHSNPLNYPLLFDSTGRFVFGALSENIKNERVYFEISGGGAYDDRYKNFLKKPFYRMLQDSRDILSVIGSQQFQDAAGPITMLKDATDMILLDTLLNQQDRMYNQHYKWTWLWMENGEIKRQRVRAKQNDDGKVLFDTQKDQDELIEMRSKNAFMIKEMILKDNDCGVRGRFYSNKMKEVRALEGIRHMSGRTYTAFLKLAQAIRDPQMQDYLKNETLMSSVDLKVLLDNIVYAESVIQDKCRGGQLKLDLDLESHFGTQKTSFSCTL